MGLSKTEHFTNEQNTMANIAKALGHPARIAILEFLLRSDRCICGDIVEHLPLAQATISQHLRALKEAGLIKGTIEGASVCYCVNEETLGQLREYLLRLTATRHSDRCC